MAYPIDIKFDGVNPGEEPKVRVTYQCDGYDDAMQKMYEACAIHGGVSAHYDSEAKVLTMELG